jgi:hypothetical protein
MRGRKSVKVEVDRYYKAKRILFVCAFFVHCLVVKKSNVQCCGFDFLFDADPDQDKDSDPDAHLDPIP